MGRHWDGVPLPNVAAGDLAQADRALDLLTTKYLKAWISYQGIERAETLQVPEAALREALLNALMHRDYSVGAPVQIKVFPDHLTIWNPGALPPTWSAARLTEAHPSLPPNPDVAAAFFRAGMVEAWGRGIARMFAACREAGVPEPTYKVEPDGIWTEFRYRPGAVLQVGAGSALPVTPPVTPPVAALLRLLAEAGPLGNAEIRERLGLKDRTHLRERYLTPALEAGLIAPTIPDKPQSRLQKYRLTAQGQATLAATRRA